MLDIIFSRMRTGSNPSDINRFRMNKRRKYFIYLSCKVILTRSINIGSGSTTPRARSGRAHQRRRGTMSNRSHRDGLHTQHAARRVYRRRWYRGVGSCWRAGGGWDARLQVIWSGAAHPPHAVTVCHTVVGYHN